MALTSRMIWLGTSGFRRASRKKKFTGLPHNRKLVSYPRPHVLVQAQQEVSRQRARRQLGPGFRHSAAKTVGRVQAADLVERFRRFRVFKACGASLRLSGAVEAQGGRSDQSELLRHYARFFGQTSGADEALVRAQLALRITRHPADRIIDGGVLEARHNGI